jgi:TnpA family transposase
MPRRSILTEFEQNTLFSIQSEISDMSKYYLFSEADLSIIKQKRGNNNKLGFSVLLCCLRYPGTSFDADTPVSNVTIEFIANQLKIKDFSGWRQYFKREATRREHLLELQNIFGYKTFTNDHYQNYLLKLLPLTKISDLGLSVVEHLITMLRADFVIIPSIKVVERLCAEAITLGSQAFYSELISDVTDIQKQNLNSLLKLMPDSKISYLHWLLQPATIPKPKHMLGHIARLRFINNLNLSVSLGKNVHQNRLNKLAREGRNMFARDINEFEPARRYATLVAVIINTKASIIDEIIELNDKILGNIFNKAKNSHNEEFQSSSKSINEKLNTYAKIGQALIKAKQENLNPFVVIEEIMTWDEFTLTVQATQNLARPNDFDYLYRINRHYSWLKRYMLEFLDVLEFKATNTTINIINAIDIIQAMHSNGLRKVPEDAPTNFIRNRWQSLVFKEDCNIDRQYYEFAVLSELKNALRSGDIWVAGSRQYKDFDEYLIDQNRYKQLKANNELPLKEFTTDFNQFIQSRLKILTTNLDEVHKLVINDELEEASINDDGLRISPLSNSVPDDAIEFNQQVYALLPKIKITSLLQEVDDWVGFSKHFTHLKNNKIADNKELLLTAILSDAINLGLTKMAEACPGTTYAKLASIQAWYIRDETYKHAQAIITDAQHQQPITQFWGDGSSSSSDGQRFKAGGKGVKSASVNPKYGNEPGVIYYTHTSDSYAPFHVSVITSNLRDSTYVLDGLLHHEADLNIYEHYTDTAGFTDHVFALMHLLGFKFAPRIRDLNDKRIFIPDKTKNYSKLASMVGGYLNLGLIERNWDDIVRLANSIKQGTVTSSLILRKLGSYPRQNSLAAALRELGKVERSIFMLEWIKDPKLRRRVQAGLNKGEAKHALTRAVHFNRLGESRDRTFENQLHRASGLNIVVGAIILWNTVYIGKAIDYLKANNKNFNDDLIKHLSPLGWEHINLTGDYIWSNKLKESKLRID